MRNLILGGALALVTGFAAMPAAAAVDYVRFTLTRDDFDGVLTWQLPAQPSPDYFDEVGFDLNSEVQGRALSETVGDGDAYFVGFSFYLASYGGGFSTAGLIAFDDDPDFVIPEFFVLELFGDQVFTGTTEAPTFAFGTYHLEDGGCGCTFEAADVANYTLVISEGVAAAPEPATWALMIAGFGLAGGALRRRAAAAASSTSLG